MNLEEEIEQSRIRSRRFTGLSLATLGAVGVISFGGGLFYNGNKQANNPFPNSPQQAYQYSHYYYNLAAACFFGIFVSSAIGKIGLKMAGERNFIDDGIF